MGRERVEIPEGDSASHDTPERATMATTATRDEGCHHMAWEENETFGLTLPLKQI